MKLYRKLLKYLASKELKNITDNDQLEKAEVIAALYFMATQCINSETKAKGRLPSISLSAIAHLQPSTWDKLVADYEDLIGSWYRDIEGKEYQFIALAHCKEDYYYALAPSGGGSVKLVSCVVNLETMGYIKL